MRISRTILQTLGIAGMLLLAACDKNPSEPRSDMSEERVLFIRWMGFVNEVCTMKPDGSDIQVLSRYEYGDDLTRELYFLARWSPDKKLIVLAGGPGSTLEYVPLWLMNASGEFQRKLIWNGNYPFWAKDGEHIIYTRRRGYFSITSDIFRININTLQEEILLFAETGEPGSGSGYSYTLLGIVPGGNTHLLLKEMYTYRDSSGKQTDDDPEILIYDYFAREKTYLTDNSENEGWARISPDGKQVVFTRKNHVRYVYTNNLYLMTLEDSSVRQQTTGLSEVYRNLTWSPDGRELMFKVTNKDVTYPFQEWWESFVVIMDIQSGSMDTLKHYTDQDSVSFLLMDWK